MHSFDTPPKPENMEFDEMMRMQRELEDLLHKLPDSERHALRVPIDTLTIKALLSHDLETFTQLKKLTAETIQKVKNKK